MTDAGDEGARRQFLPLLAARLVRRYPPPQLTPLEAQELDADERYRFWNLFPEAATFHKLNAAGQAALEGEEVAKRAWQTVIRPDVGPGELRAALLEATPLITDQADALSVVWEHLDSPFCLPPMRTWDEPLPHFAGFRALARLLALDAHRRLTHGDRDGALETTLVGLRFGLQIARGSNLLGRLVSCAVQAMCRRALWPALPHASPAALRDALRDLQTALASASPLTETISEEKRFVLRFLLHGWNATGIAPGDAPPPQMELRTQLAALLRGKPHVFRCYGAYLDTWQDFARRGVYRPVLWHPDLPRSLAPSLRHSIEDTYLSDTLQTAQNRLALTAIALHVYHAEYLTWPASLDALLPLLHTLPLDPFADDAPLCYHRDGTGYLLYSVGPNGKDDGGKPITRLLPVVVGGKSRDWEGVPGDIVAGVNL